MRHKAIMKEKAEAGGSNSAAQSAPSATASSSVKASGEGEPGTDSFDPNDPPKPLADMSMPEQL